jgi:CubicO group peptidase (beta-lactamase class C family)
MNIKLVLRSTHFLFYLGTLSLSKGASTSSARLVILRSLRKCEQLILLCMLALLLAGCSSSPATPASTYVPASPTVAASVASVDVPTQAISTAPYWPTQDWRVSTPEAQGMDPHKLAQMLVSVKQQHLGLHSLLVIRNGTIVSETYFLANQPSIRHELYSVTKSFVSTLVGIALDKGFIKRLDQRILDFFPGRSFANLDAQKQAMTLEDVLTMRSGLDWQEGDPAYMALYRSPDWVSYMLDLPMVAPPGSQFNYCSGCTHLLSAILEQTTGMNPRLFAEQNLFKPLGISKLTWETDSKGIPIGGWGLQLSSRDMAKLGYLFLHNGLWDGQQVVSAQWVQAATQKHTTTDGDLGYGYQWWTVPSLAGYAALGRYGQTIFVAPAENLVVVATAQMENHDPIFKLIKDYILPAVQEQH